MNDLLTSFNRVKEGFMKVVRGCVNELNKIVLCYSVNYIICILFGYMHMIIFHLGTSKDGHLSFDMYKDKSLNKK